jgi:hypothetical protein
MSSIESGLDQLLPLEPNWGERRAYLYNHVTYSNAFPRLAEGTFFSLDVSWRCNHARSANILAKWLHKRRRGQKPPVRILQPRSLRRCEVQRFILLLSSCPYSDVVEVEDARRVSN